MNKYYFTTEVAFLLNPPLPSKFSRIHNGNLESVYSSQKKTPLGCSPLPDIPSEYLFKRFGATSSKELSAADLIHPSKNRVHLSTYGQEFNPKNKFVDLAPAGVKCEKSETSDSQMRDILEQTSNKKSTIILPSSYAKRLNSYDQTSPFQCNSFPCTPVKSEKSQTHANQFRDTLKDRNAVETLWNLLKIKNHVNFKNLKSAFESYQGGDGKITTADLQSMCQKLGLLVPLCIIQKLIKQCDIIDFDGCLSFEEFVHSLNWKDIMPVDSKCKTSYSTDWQEGINNPPVDIIDHYKTTYSSLGDHKNLNFQRPAGKGNLDHKNKYQENLASILQPSSFSTYGVSIDDIANLHSKEEIYDLLNQSGIEISSGAFQKVWEKINKNGYASIGDFWKELKSVCLLQFIKT